jgi:predicted secreted protein
MVEFTVSLRFGSSSDFNNKSRSQGADVLLTRLLLGILGSRACGSKETIEMTDDDGDGGRKELLQMQSQVYCNNEQE